MKHNIVCLLPKRDNIFTLLRATARDKATNRNRARERQRIRSITHSPERNHYNKIYYFVILFKKGNRVLLFAVLSCSQSQKLIKTIELELKTDVEKNDVCVRSSVQTIKIIEKFCLQRSCIFVNKFVTVHDDKGDDDDEKNSSGRRLIITIMILMIYYGNKGGLTGYVSISYYVEIENIGVMELQAAYRYTRVAPLKAAHALISYC
uniref:Uncharacterized protein n=1 Tax=Glossina palpalis gambiensis TaxID=67801 RepID=A0A1B0BNP4_9MUSC